MGGQISSIKHKINHKGYLQEWETIDHLFDYDLVRNIRTNWLGQARKYKLEPTLDPQQQLLIYHLRKEANVPLVKSYSAEILEKVSRKKEKQQNPGICSKINHIGVVTERIPFIFSQFPQISFSESLYILNQALQGYQYLYPRSGPVHVTSKMIGLNTEGKAKVWINENFHENHPTYEIKSLLSTRNQKLDRQYNMIAPQYRDQKEMIENIIDVVQQKNQNGQFPSQFRALLRQNSYSFRNAITFVNDFIRDRNIQVPSNLRPLLSSAQLRNNIDANKKINQIIYQKPNIHQNPQQIRSHLDKIGNTPMVYFDSQRSPQIPSQQPQININRYFPTNTHSNIINVNSKPTNIQNQPSYPLIPQPQPLHIQNSSFNLKPAVKINFGNKTY